jgi:uncharacterized protein YjiS (DUF1127 family)
MRKQSAVNEGASATSVCANRTACPQAAAGERKMTTLSPTAGRPARADVSGGFVRWIEAGAHALLTYLERRAAIKTLRQLDDRALRDIGISRCQIEAAVGGALYAEMARRR